MWIYNFTVTIISQNILRTFFVQNSIPYKTYVREKHLESILGTRKNMTKKVFNLNTYRLTVTIISQKYQELSVMIVSQKYQDLLLPNSRDCFSKILRTFYASRKLWIIVVFLLRTLKEKLPIFLINTLLLHIPLLALKDRQNYRGTELQRNEYTRFTWAGGTFFHFQLCCCVSFLFWREIGFGCTYYYVLRVPYSCGVVLVFLSSVWWVRDHYYDRKKK